MTIRVPHCLTTGTFLIRFVVGEDVEAAVFDAPRRSFTLDFAGHPASERIVEIAEPDVGTGWLQLSSTFSGSSAANTTTNVQVRAHRANKSAVMAQMLLTIVVFDADADECTSDLSFATQNDQREDTDWIAPVVAASVGAWIFLLIVVAVLRHKRNASGRAVFEPTDGLRSHVCTTHANPVFKLESSRVAVGNPPGEPNGAAEGPSESIDEIFMRSLSGNTVFSIPFAETTSDAAAPQNDPPPATKAMAGTDGRADVLPINERVYDVATFMPTSDNPNEAVYDQATSHLPCDAASASRTGMASGMPTYDVACQSPASPVYDTASAGDIESFFAIYDMGNAATDVDAAVPVLYDVANLRQNSDC